MTDPQGARKASLLLINASRHEFGEMFGVWSDGFEMQFVFV